HIRIADRVAKDLAASEEGIGPVVLRLIRRQINDPSLPLRGKFWLLSALERVDRLKYDLRAQWLDSENVQVLMTQSLDAVAGIERQVALNLLWRLGFIDALTRSDWERAAARVIEWLPDMSADESFGFRWLLSGLRGSHDDLYAEVCESLPARQLAQMLSVRGTRYSASAWAEVIREIQPRHDSPHLDGWRADFADGVNHAALAGWMATVDEYSHNDDVYELIDALAGACPPAAVTALQAVADHMRSWFESDLLDASHGASRWAFGNMHMIAMIAGSPGGLRRSDSLDDGSTDVSMSTHDKVDEKVDGTSGVVVVGSGEEAPGEPDNEMWVPSAEMYELAEAASEFMRSVDWTKAGASVKAFHAPDVQSLDLVLFLVGVFSTDLLDDLAVAIRHDWLDDVSVNATNTNESTETDEKTTATGGPQLSDPLAGTATHPRDVSAVSAFLAAMSRGERGGQHARAYVVKRLGSLTRMPSNLIDVFPDLAAQLVADGRDALVPDPRARGWGGVIDALDAIRRVDPAAAARVLRSSTTRITDTIAKPQDNDMSRLDEFIAIADELDPAVLDDVIAGIDAETSEPAWRTRLTDQTVQTTALLGRAARVDGPVGDVARRLLSG
ncbi:MAG: hypothetical protein Q7T55_09905, partial [Solirubrobacteraceae bacterium]|nr:hypothetical protein [Solirubrobacteraceae bacterium]